MKNRSGYQQRWDLKRGFCIIDGYKFCSKCNQVKCTNDYFHNKKKKDLLSSYCKYCDTKTVQNRRNKKYNENARTNDENLGYCILPNFKICKKCKEIKNIDLDFYKIFNKMTNKNIIYNVCCSCIKLQKLLERRKLGLQPKRIGKEQSTMERECFSCNRILSIGNFPRRVERGTLSRKCKLCVNQSMRLRNQNIINKLTCNLRAEFHNWINKKYNKSKWQNILTLSLSEFKKFLENQFVHSMNWNNYGKFWHIDHIVPCSLFDFDNSELIRICFNYNNLTPLTAKKNIRKSDFLPNGIRARDIPKIKTKQELLDLIKTWPNPREFEWVKKIS